MHLHLIHLINNKKTAADKNNLLLLRNLKYVL